MNIAIDATRIYWIGRSHIRSVCKSGGVPVDVAEITADDSGSGSLALDDDTVFWTEFYGGHGYLLSAPKSGGPTRMISFGGFARDMVLDDTAIYWGDDTYLWRADKMTLTPVILEDHGGVGSIAVDASTVFWSGSQQLVWRGPKEGGEATAFTYGTGPLAMDEDHILVSWNGIFALTKNGDGSSPSKINDWDAGELVLDDAHVFFRDGATISRTSKDHPDLVVLASDANRGSIAVDENSVYWSDFGAGTILRAPK